MSKSYKKVERYVKQNDEYNLISQWTSSDTVEMKDGKTLEEKIIEKTDVNIDQDTISEVEPKAGETFTVIDNITKDKNGHIEKVNTKTVTMPTTSIKIDNSLSDESENPVQNKVITNRINNKVDKIEGKGLSTNDFSNLHASQLAKAYSCLNDVSLNSGVPDFLYMKPMEDYSGITIQQGGTIKEMLWAATKALTNAINNLNEKLIGKINRYGSHNASVGYAKIAHITITGTYIDKPMAFKIATRDGKMSDVLLMFSGESHADPGVKYFTITGVNYAYAVRTDAGEWDLFIYNRAWQDIDVVDYKFPYYLDSKVKVEWTQEFETTLPAGFVVATRVDNVLNTVEACEASTNIFDLAGAAAVKELSGRFVTGTTSVNVVNGFGTFSIDHTFEAAPFIVAQPMGYIISGNSTVSVVPVSITALTSNFRITFSNVFNGTVSIKWFAFGN
ncbi:MAG: hypothetical protein IJ711_00805 [Lachnospiraceae bacterium]|nr:hypothetical protein [Lachnospiraceae bacterium]